MRKQLLQQKLEEKLELKLGQNLEQMKTFVRAEIAKVKAPGIPDCPRAAPAWPEGPGLGRDVRSPTVPRS